MRVRGRTLGLWQGVALTLCLLVGCTPVRSPVPPARPVTPPPAPEAPQTPASAAARAHYARVQSALLAEGLLRTQTAPEDAPFTDRNLTENFLHIALFDEYSGGTVTARSTPAAIPLRRWVAPVRVAVAIGPAVPAAEARTDRARIAAYLARLAALTGHPMTLVDQGANLWVHVATVDERQALGPQLRRELDEITDNQIAAVTRMSPDTYCQVITAFDAQSSTLTHAVVVIPAEQPDLLRLACLHEELAQSLGLPNDSAFARPSIFNDNQEFALLTRQDELMLRILYDRALRPGMTKAEARPIVETLATRLIDAHS